MKVRPGQYKIVNSINNVPPFTLLLSQVISVPVPPRPLKDRGLVSDIVVCQSPDGAEVHIFVVKRGLVFVRKLWFSFGLRAS